MQWKTIIIKHDKNHKIDEIRDETRDKLTSLKREQ